MAALHNHKAGLAEAVAGSTPSAAFFFFFFAFPQDEKQMKHFEAGLICNSICHSWRLDAGGAPSPRDLRRSRQDERGGSALCPPSWPCQGSGERRHSSRNTCRPRVMRQPDLPTAPPPPRHPPLCQPSSLLPPSSPP